MNFLSLCPVDTQHARVWFTLTCENAHILVCGLGAKPTDTFYFSLYKSPPEALRAQQCGLLLNPYMFLNRASRQADGGSEPDSNLYHFLLNPDPRGTWLTAIKWIVHDCQSHFSLLHCHRFLCMWNLQDHQNKTLLTVAQIYKHYYCMQVMLLTQV